MAFAALALWIITWSGTTVVLRARLGWSLGGAVRLPFLGAAARRLRRCVHPRLGARRLAFAQSAQQLRPGLGHSCILTRLELSPRTRPDVRLAPLLLAPVARASALVLGVAAAATASLVHAAASAAALGTVSAFAIAIIGAARGGGVAQDGLPLITRVMSVFL